MNKEGKTGESEIIDIWQNYVREGHSLKRAGATAQRPASLKLALDMIIEGIKKGIPEEDHRPALGSHLPLP